MSAETELFDELKDIGLCDIKTMHVCTQDPRWSFKQVCPVHGFRMVYLSCAECRAFITDFGATFRCPKCNRACELRWDLP